MVWFRVIWVVSECHNSVQDECRHVAKCSTAEVRCQGPIVSADILEGNTLTNAITFGQVAGCPTRWSLICHLDFFSKALILCSCKVCFHGCCLAHQWCLPPMGTPHWPTRQLGLSREKGFETKFAPAETKGRIEASLFWFHTTVKSTALKGSPPQRRFMRTGSRALSINRAQICTTHPKKTKT